MPTVARQPANPLTPSLFPEDPRIPPTAPSPRTRINDQIRITPLRVVDADGTQLGILERGAALELAQSRNLDLVEVAATARPPVCRIMDYGKFKFEQSKQARVAKKKQHVVELKEVKFRPQIGEHDFEVKMRHIREFLGEGHKVRLVLQFRGRQITHPELGQAVVQRVIDGIADLGKVEQYPKPEGKLIIAVLGPLSGRKAEPKTPRATAATA